MIHCPKACAVATGRVNLHCDFSHCSRACTGFILKAGQWRKYDEHVDSNLFDFDGRHHRRDF